jgi:deoxyribodipyrimidine photo-lyase
MPPAIVWFRFDLRLADNPALAAAARHDSVIPVFVWSPGEEAPWAPGSASRVWLHASLGELAKALRTHGSRLVVRRGPALEALASLVRETGAAAVYWNRCYEPAVVARDTRIKAALRAEGLEAESFRASLLFEPWEIRTRAGQPHRVFTPFWNACLQQPRPAEPLPAPSLPAPARWPESLELDALELDAGVDWAGGIRASWKPGESGALTALDRFLAESIAEYGDRRDRPDEPGTSLLSPHLHFGEISARQVWHAVARSASPAAEAFLRQLGWREFGYHLLHHFPDTPLEPLRYEYAAFPWEDDVEGLAAWQRGQTGYPLVDAGMRQLWETGWMHNRARMTAASFLVKDLLLPWQEGARWFWDTLVDADLANNTLGWQWTAGCGADAAPFFRVFNPVKQGERFDPSGDYVRRFVPELAALPAEWIHRPWEAPTAVLEAAGVALGHVYPRPLVDHAEARKRALTAFQAVKAART